MRYLKTLAAFFLGCIMLSLTIEGPLFHIDQNKAFAATPTATSTATPTPTPSATPTVTLYASKDCLSGDGQRKTWCPPATQCTTGQVAVYGPGPDPGSNDIGASTCATNGGATGLQQPSAAPTPGQYLSTNSSSNPPTLIWASGATPVPTATPVIGGGGSLATGSNSYGRITGLAATSNVLTLPSAACPNDLTCIFQDNTTGGGIKVTSQTSTSVTFSATASDACDYVCGCR